MCDERLCAVCGVYEAAEACLQFGLQISTRWPLFLGGWKLAGERQRGTKRQKLFAQSAMVSQNLFECAVHCRTVIQENSIFGWFHISQQHPHGMSYKLFTWEGVMPLTWSDIQMQAKSEFQNLTWPRLLWTKAGKTGISIWPYSLTFMLRTAMRYRVKLAKQKTIWWQLVADMLIIFMLWIPPQEHDYMLNQWCLWPQLDHGALMTKAASLSPVPALSGDGPSLATSPRGISGSVSNLTNERYKLICASFSSRF